MAYDDTDSDKICKVGCTRTFKPTRQQSLWIENAAQRGIPMSREQKNWLTNSVNSNAYFKRSVPLSGYRFDFSDVLKRYIVKQYGHLTEYYAVDKTALKTILYGRIDEIIEITN